jgi:hypothetical protein
MPVAIITFLMIIILSALLVKARRVLLLMKAVSVWRGIKEAERFDTGFALRYFRACTLLSLGLLSFVVLLLVLQL